jgi:hypothetical protein
MSLKKKYVITKIEDVLLSNLNVDPSLYKSEIKYTTQKLYKLFKKLSKEDSRLYRELVEGYKNLDLGR